MTLQIKGFFDEIKKNKMTGGVRQYFPLGVHLWRMESCKFDQTRAGMDYFASDGVILKTTSEVTKQGYICSYYTENGKDRPFFGNIKNVFCALLNKPEQEIDAMNEKEFSELTEAISGVPQICSGFILEVHTNAGVNKKKGTEYLASAFRTPKFEEIKEFNPPSLQVEWLKSEVPA